MFKKIEIDLNDILTCEEGQENLSESIKRQVIESVKTDIFKKVERETMQEISDAIKKKVSETLSIIKIDFAKELLESEYYPSLDGWVTKSKIPCTFKTMLSEEIRKEFKYKGRHPSSYDTNEYTKTVNSVVDDAFSKFKQEFKKQIDEELLKEMKNYAITTLKEKLGLK
jgi:hypothetical protein